MKLRYILIASLLCIVVGVISVGSNANTAQQLAQKVLSADNNHQSLDNSKSELDSYVHGHMGTSITVFLASSYNAAVKAAADANPSGAGQIYHDAQAACVSRTSAVVQATCVQSYLSSHPAPATPEAPAIDKNSYTLDYPAPRWTPDLAGFLLVLGFVGLVTTGGLWLVRRR